MFALEDLQQIRLHDVPTSSRGAKLPCLGCLYGSYRVCSGVQDFDMGVSENSGYLILGSL